MSATYYMFCPDCDKRWDGDTWKDDLPACYQCDRELEIDPDTFKEAAGRITSIVNEEICFFDENLCGTFKANLCKEFIPKVGDNVTLWTKKGTCFLTKRL